MSGKQARLVFCCQTCGHQSAKWVGRCPGCGEWNSFQEEPESLASLRSANTGANLFAQPVPIETVEISDQVRLATGIGEFDRVLGGGVVAGSLVLIGGDPGIGKSTLMLQALHGMASAGNCVLYSSGEESVQQIRLRSKRLGAGSERLLVVSEIALEAILSMVDSIKPDVLVVDSIQTVFSAEISSAPGSVGQVRESTMRLMQKAKSTQVPIFLIGHVTKEGAIAGPRLLEHMVDTVLYFEGDRNHVFRILRAVKNRFGSTNEIGVFEMKERGLAEVSSPSEVFLSERRNEAPGSVVTACMEGTRPVLVELQALTSSTYLATPRRTVLGLDHNRVSLLVAVIEKKLGFQLAGNDLFMNVAGGMKVEEPAVDMGILCAVISSFLDKPVPAQTVVFGEIGLTGEVRAISQPEARIAEAQKMGFSVCLMPETNLRRIVKTEGIRLEGVQTAAQAADILF